MNNERDEELVEYIESLEKNDSLTYLEKMQKVIDWKKENRGLKGYHISLSPYANDVSNEEIAKEMFAIALDSASGNLIEDDVDGM